MRANLLLMALAGCLLIVQVAEANKIFCRPGHWKKPSDCNSFYGETCGQCCAAFKMTGRVSKNLFSLSPCTCVSRKHED